VKSAVIFLLILLPVQTWGGNRHTKTSKAPAADPGYVRALATANRFLHAWQTGDLETGTVLLSDHARHSRNPEMLEEYFSAGQDRAFEIMRGASRGGRYRFPVILITVHGDVARRVSSEIVVTNTGKNDWAVDKLP
jgi:hypothetical protein